MHAFVTCYRGGGLLLLGPALVVLLAGCGDSSTEPETVDPGATMTVDASSETAWTFVDLASPAQVVQVSDGASSAVWDLAFQKTAIKANGDANGPAGVLVHCVCQNAGATNEQIMAMTAATELADLESVTKSQIPSAAEAWSATALDEKRWYKYNLTGTDHQIWPTFDVYLIKRGNEVYKVQIINYYKPDGTARHVSFRYAKLDG